MRFLRSAFLGLAAAVAILLASAPVQAQVVFTGYDIRKVTSVGGGYGTISTNIPILIRYIGSSTGGGEVTVASNGDITLSINTVADASVKCPSGGSSGIIDVSDAACDTFGEVINVINASSTWRAVLLDAVASDSSNDTLAALSITTADSVDGLGLLADGTVALNTTYNLTTLTSLKDYVEPVTYRLNPNAYAESTRQLLSATANATISAGATTFQVLCAQGVFAPTTRAYSETVRTIYAIPGAATTVQFTPTVPTLGFMCNQGEKLLVRYKGSSANFTAASIAAFGFVYRW